MLNYSYIGPTRISVNNCRYL